MENTNYKLLCVQKIKHGRILSHFDQVLKISSYIFNVYFTYIYLILKFSNYMQNF